MTLHDSLEKLLAQRQAACDHSYQDRVVAPDRIFCGKCGKVEK